MINKQAFFRIWLRNAIPLAVSLMRPLRLKVVFFVILTSSNLLGTRK